MPKHSSSAYEPEAVSSAYMDGPSTENHTITFDEGVTTGYDHNGKPYVSFTAKRINLPAQEIEKLLTEAGVPKITAVVHLEEMLDGIYQRMLVEALLAHKA